MMLAAAMLFHAHVPDNAVAARKYFEHAMRLYAGSQQLRDRCGILFSNWDTPCPHAMLLLVQGSGHYDSWFAIRLRDFAEQHIGFPDEQGTFPKPGGDQTIMCACCCIFSLALAGVCLCVVWSRPATGAVQLYGLRTDPPALHRVTGKGARMYYPARARGTNIVWGGLRNLGTAGHIAAAVADFPGAPRYLRTRYACFAVSQLNYILGDSGRSFMVGEGRNSPKHPHSRDAFCARDWTVAQCNNDEFGSRTVMNGNVRPAARAPCRLALRRPCVDGVRSTTRADHGGCDR